MRLTRCVTVIRVAMRFPRLALTTTLMFVGLAPCRAVPRTVGHEARTPSHKAIATADPAQPRNASGCAWFRNISLASVEVTPKEIHKRASPNAAVVTAKVQYNGPGPVVAGAEATVAAYTNSTNPSVYNIAYGSSKSIGNSKPLTLELKDKTTEFQFSVYPAPQTVTGNVTIRATIIDTKGCVAVVDRTNTTVLKTVVP